MTQAANLVTFPQGTNHAIWIRTYSEACLSRKSPGTIDVYQRVLRDFLLWLVSRPGHASFHLDQLTHITIERKRAFIIGSVRLNNKRTKISGTGLLTSRIMIYATILPIGREKLAGRSKRSPVTWDM